MNRLIFFLAMVTFMACNNTDSTPEQATSSVPKTETPPSNNANLDVTALAQTTCDCVKKLMEERGQIAKLREEGKKGEALKLITNSRRTQQEAFECSKPHMESIRYNKEKYQSFETALLSKCPQGGTALLIMHDIHYKE